MAKITIEHQGDDLFTSLVFGMAYHWRVSYPNDPFGYVSGWARTEKGARRKAERAAKTTYTYTYPEEK